MKFEGTHTIKASRDKVYSFLLDPNSVGRCLPDLQSIEVSDPEHFRAKVKAGVGFIKGTFDMRMEIADKVPPSHARLVAHGSGTGSAIDLDAAFDLGEAPGGETTMKWAADARVSGLIASVGSRLLNSAAEKVVSQLFERVKAELEKA